MSKTKIWNTNLYYFSNSAPSRALSSSKFPNIYVEVMGRIMKHNLEEAAYVSSKIETNPLLAPKNGQEM